MYPYNPIRTVFNQITIPNHPNHRHQKRRQACLLSEPTEVQALVFQKEWQLQNRLLESQDAPRLAYRAGTDRCRARHGRSSKHTETRAILDITAPTVQLLLIGTSCHVLTEHNSVQTWHGFTVFSGRQDVALAGHQAPSRRLAQGDAVRTLSLVVG